MSCTCVRVKDENLGIFPDADAIKHRNIAFKPIFSPVERKKPKNGIVIGCWQNKRSDGLKNGFSCFCTLKYPDKHAKNVLFCRITRVYACACICIYYNKGITYVKVLLKVNSLHNYVKYKNKIWFFVR